jgi:hypothetical protein
LEDQTKEFVQLLLQCHKSSGVFNGTVVSLAQILKSNNLSDKSLEQNILIVLHSATKLQKDLSSLIEGSIDACMKRSLD